MGFGLFSRKSKSSLVPPTNEADVHIQKHPSQKSKKSQTSRKKQKLMKRDVSVHEIMEVGGGWRRKRDQSEGEGNWEEVKVGRKSCDTVKTVRTVDTAVFLMPIKKTEAKGWKVRGMGEQKSCVGQKEGMGEIQRKGDGKSCDPRMGLVDGTVSQNTPAGNTPKRPTFPFEKLRPPGAEDSVEDEKTVITEEIVEVEKPQNRDRSMQPSVEQTTDHQSSNVKAPCGSGKKRPLDWLVLGRWGHDHGSSAPSEGSSSKQHTFNREANMAQRTEEPIREEQVVPKEKSTTGTCIKDDASPIVPPSTPCARPSALPVPPVRRCSVPVPISRTHPQVSQNRPAQANAHHLSLGPEVRSYAVQQTFIRPRVSVMVARPVVAMVPPPIELRKLESHKENGTRSSLPLSTHTQGNAKSVRQERDPSAQKKEGNMMKAVEQPGLTARAGNASVKEDVRPPRVPHSHRVPTSSIPPPPHPLSKLPIHKETTPPSPSKLHNGNNEGIAKDEKAGDWERVLRQALSIQSDVGSRPPRPLDLRRLAIAHHLSDTQLASLYSKMDDGLPMRRDSLPVCSAVPVAQTRGSGVALVPPPRRSSVQSGTVLIGARAENDVNGLRQMGGEKSLQVVEEKHEGEGGKSGKKEELRSHPKEAEDEDVVIEPITLHSNSPTGVPETFTSPCHTPLPATTNLATEAAPREPTTADENPAHNGTHAKKDASQPTTQVKTEPMKNDHDNNASYHGPTTAAPASTTLKTNASPPPTSMNLHSKATPSPTDPHNASQPPPPLLHRLSSLHVTSSPLSSPSLTPTNHPHPDPLSTPQQDDQHHTYRPSRSAPGTLKLFRRSTLHKSKRQRSHSTSTSTPSSSLFTSTHSIPPVPRVPSQYRPRTTTTVQVSQPLPPELHNRLRHSFVGRTITRYTWDTQRGMYKLEQMRDVGVEVKWVKGI
ncbi:hypothetical protein BC832DRAFT_206082 [Gaertneriomyces semiglobifer]|nr:hypothetical protein BC832DRAFT_206082 [Gaertneriomyces semiglobifer]